MNHHNWDYDGGSPNLPVAVGDRLYAQDLFRDFLHTKDDAGKKVKEAFADYPVLLTDSEIVQGADFDLIDIPISIGLVNFQVRIPDSFSGIPPTSQLDDIIALVESTAQTDFDISGTATLDGSTVNYVKLAYAETDGNSRARAKKAGSYNYERVPSFSITVSSAAATNYQVVLAEIIGDGSSFITINNYSKTPRKRFELVSADDEMRTGKKYHASGVIELTLPVHATAGDEIEVQAKDLTRIVQSDSEQVISWKNSRYTTKGTSGYFELPARDRARLMYIGSGNSRIEPGTKLSDPASLPGGSGLGVRFSLDGVYLAVSNFTASPYITIYKRSGDTFTKLSDPASLPTGNGNDVAFSPNGIYMAVAHTTTPFVTIYKRSGDTFTKLSDPASLPANQGLGAAFSPDGIYLAISHQSSPYITIYKRSGDTFTKLSNPSSLPTGDARRPCFSHDGVYLAVPHAASPYITIYKRSGDTFTKLSNPASLPAGNAFCADFSSDGVYLAVAHANSPYITIYRISEDTFTKLSNPSSLPAGEGGGATFSPDVVYLAVPHAASPYITIYKRSGDTFTKLSDPASLPTGNGQKSWYTSDGIYLAVGFNSSPYIHIYKNVESADHEWQLIELDVLNPIQREYLFQ